MRHIIPHQPKSINIKFRIDSFINKLKDETNKKKINNIIDNEIRWLGISSTPRFALNTIRSYLTIYRSSIAEQLKTPPEALEKLGEILEPYEDILKNNKSFNFLQKKKEKSTSDDIIKNIHQLTSDLPDELYPLFDQLKALKVAHPAYYRMRMKPSQANIIKKSYKTSLVDGKADRLTINRADIKKVVEENLNSKSYYRRLVALMLCSGRRPVELCKTAKFSDLQQGFVSFQGQAKNRKTTTPEAYNINILHVSEQDFLSAFKGFRTMIRGIKNLDNRAINARISAHASNVTRKLLDNDLATLYTCRSIYANWVADLYPDRDRDLVMAQVLGHEKGDIYTVNSYQNVFLTDDPVEKTIIKRQRKQPVGHRKPLVKKEAGKRTKRQERLLQTLKKRTEEAESLGRACLRIHQWAIQHVEQGRTEALTQSFITRELGASRPAIKKWLAMMDH